MTLGFRSIQTISTVQKVWFKFVQLSPPIRNFLMSCSLCTSRVFNRRSHEDIRKVPDSICRINSNTTSQLKLFWSGLNNSTLVKLQHRKNPTLRPGVINSCRFPSHNRICVVTFKIRMQDASTMLVKFSRWLLEDSNCFYTVELYLAL